MEADIEKLMSSKSFSELTMEEREEWKDLFSNEEEYNQMRSMFAGLELVKEEEFEPSSNVKQSLDSLFEKTYGAEEISAGTSTVWMKLFPKDKSLFQRPLVQMAAALVLVLLAVPFFMQNRLTNESVQVAKEESITSTSPATTIGPKLEDRNGLTAAEAKDNFVPPVVDGEVFPMENERAMSQAFEDLQEASVSAPPPVALSHSDLDFEKTDTYGNTANNATIKSTSAAEQKGVMDLLTVTY